jgi:HEAT repeats
MKTLIKGSVLGLFTFWSLQGLDAQQRKGPLTKAQLDKILAKREEKQQAREASNQAKAVRGLVIRLGELVTNIDEEVRYNAAMGLVEIGPSAAQAVSALTSRLFDESPRVRAAAALALSSIGPDAKDAVPDLVIALQDSSPLVRPDLGVGRGADAGQAGIGDDAGDEDLRLAGHDSTSRRAAT